MSNLDTFEGSTPEILDPLYRHQKEGVSRMRTSLLACSDDPITTKRAIQNITTMRVYHQIARIIKYLELMDKLEDKLYKALEHTIDNAKEDSMSTWMMLLNAQERLQKTMIESHKLLQPYLDIQEFSIVELTSNNEEVNSTNSNILIGAESREKIRTRAQEVLAQLVV